MSDLWMYFAVNFATQLLIFLCHAYYERNLAEAPHLIWLGFLSSIVPGPLSDLFGKYLGLGTYALGFGPLSLALNVIFLYSLFAANTLLLQNSRFLWFCMWTFVYVAVFEVTNLFYPMWTYAYPVPSIEYFALAFGAPLVLAMSFALAWHVLFGCRFMFIDNAFKMLK